MFLSTYPSNYSFITTIYSSRNGVVVGPSPTLCTRFHQLVLGYIIVWNLIFLLKTKNITGELYWITVLGRISCVTGILSAVSFIALTVLIVACIVMYINGYTDDEDVKKVIKITKMTGIFAVSITVLTIFVPSTKQALLIYGVGETVDYIRQNPTAKQLPDKCIKVLDKWADSQLETDSI